LPAIVLYFRDHETESKSFALISLLILATAPKPYWYVGTDAWTNANVWFTPILLLVFQFGTIFYLRFTSSVKIELKNQST
jgi:hypothetical protein